MSESFERTRQAAEELCIEARKHGIDPKQLMSGERACKLGSVDPNSFTTHDSFATYKSMRATLDSVPADWRGGHDDYHANADKFLQQFEQTKRTGKMPPPSERPVGFICGNEPPAERARMWVDLALAPPGKAVLGGECAYQTQTLIGYDALMKGTNANALECMCAFLGLAGMVSGAGSGRAASGDQIACVGAVTAAMAQHATTMAPSLCQWLAHQPVGQDYMYGGDWKRPERSSDALPMSPLLTTEAALMVTSALLELLWLMSDPQTDVRYDGRGAAFVRACVASRHFPAALRRLVQLAARHDTAELTTQFGGLPVLALQSLDALCAREPAAAALLRTHARAASVLRPMAKLAADDPSATRLQREHGPAVRRLLRLTVETLVDASAPRAREMRARECQECDCCGAWCERQKRCAGCKAVSYCDAVCQKAAWKKHKKACQAKG